MAVVVDRVAAVDVLPVVARQELVLRAGRAHGEAQGEALVQPLHLLQEHQVGGDAADRFAQRGEHEAAPRSTEAHVGIQREDVEGRHAARVCRRRPARDVMACRPRLAG